MTYRVKVNTAHGPEYHYAFGSKGLDRLLDRLYSGAPINAFVEARP